MRHGTFGGHEKSFAHEPVALQSITQTPATHVPFGQPSSHNGRASAVPSEVTIAASGVTPMQEDAGAAHQPSVVQTWPPAQSLGFAHETVQSRIDGE
jgi:hypothetical protein